MSGFTILSADGAVLQVGQLDYETLSCMLGAVPDSPSEIAVTNEHRKLLAWDKHADTIRRDRDAALEERDAERAHAEAAQKELTEETRLREFWRDRCFAAEKDRNEAQKDCDGACDAFQTVHLALKSAKEQIVRLMAERDEAQAERNALRDDLAMTAVRLGVALTQAATQTPVQNTPTHNPFREFGGDRRRVGS